LQDLFLDNTSRADDLQARTFIRKGRAMLAEGRVADAHAAFCLALNLAPHATEANALVSLTWLLLGAPYLAQHHAQIALQVELANPDALLALAGAARRTGDTALATHATDLLASIPEARSFHQLLCLSDVIDAGDYEYALFELANFLEQHPDNVHAKELFLASFQKLQATGARCEEFIDSVGLSMPPDSRISAIDWVYPEPRSIDIIIPVFNAVEDLVACLASIDQWGGSAIRNVILVDDVSSPETVAWMEIYVRSSPHARLVRRAENGGFTAGIVSGMDCSTAPYVVLLNSDTIVGPGWLDRLWFALTRRWTTAMAGPVSNSAYFQTLIPADGHSAGLTAPRFEEDADVERVSAIILLSSRRAYPRVPFLSGFCLMLRRDIYDLAGGLDVASFPRGYWEVQDLSLRFLDLGYDAVIADDVFVRHNGGGSIDDGHRAALSQQGRRRMHDKHSALRVMTAEAICALEPEIAHLRHSWHLFRKSRRSTADIDLPPKEILHNHNHTRRPVKVVKAPRAGIGEDVEVCLFVTHAPIGQVSEYTLHYLMSLRATGLRVILCPIVQDLDVPLPQVLVEAVDAVLKRLDGGFDFAAWSDMLAVFPRVWDAKRVYFVNDSIIGPFWSLDPLIDQIRQQDAGFFALSECTNSVYHAQSFFFGWNRTNLSSEGLRSFWRDVAVQHSKDRVVLDYEHQIAPLSAELPDPSQDFVFGMEKTFGADPRHVSCVNPTHHAWRHLLASGFAFVKTDLLRDGVGSVDASGWEEECRAHGADIDAMHRHIERSRVYRTAFGQGQIVQELVSTKGEV
jgi:GT2 family glycosyltransferase